MKKTIILICVIGIFLVGGCEKKQSSIQNVNTEETTRNISNQEKDTNNSDDNFEVNKVVFEDEIIQLTCKKITNSSIKFEVMNKTDFEISWLNMDISLDGVQLSFYANNSSDQNIEGKETREIEYIGEIGSAEHQYLSLAGNIFINNSSKGAIDVCNYDIGGTKNEPTITRGKLVYDDDTVAVYYNELEINSIKFCVENKLERAITAGFWSGDELNINGKSYTSSVSTIAGKSSSIYVWLLFRGGRFMYRQYENPNRLEAELQRLKEEYCIAVEKGADEDTLINLQFSIDDLKERVNHAWQDDEE